MIHAYQRASSLVGRLATLATSLNGVDLATGKLCDKHQ